MGGIGPGLALPTIPPEMIVAAAKNLWDFAPSYTCVVYGAGCGGARRSEWIPIFRAVSEAEYQSIVASRIYSTPPGQVEGKYFSPTYEQGLLTLGNPIFNAKHLVSSLVTQKTIDLMDVEYPLNEGMVFFANPEVMDEVNYDAMASGGTKVLK